MAAFLATLVAAASATVAAADGSARVLSHGSRGEKVVALTFDDGWGHSANDRILRTLVAEQVPATFFPYALAVRSNPAFWRRVAQAGFPIGNHTWSHPDMTRLSLHDMEWQIAASRRLVESITGVPMLRVFRPPYGRYDQRVLAAASAQGFGTVLLWDATGGDSGAWPSYGSVLRGASAGTNGSVVLLHAGPAITPQALSDIITSYRSRGFRFVTVPELLGATVAPWPTPTPELSATPTPTPSDVPVAPAPTPEGSGGPGSKPAPGPAAASRSADPVPGAPGALLGWAFPLTALPSSERPPTPPSPRSTRSSPIAT